eukprot:3216758-Rhodomonas_salina.3
MGGGDCASAASAACSCMRWEEKHADAMGGRNASMLAVCRATLTLTWAEKLSHAARRSACMQSTMLSSQLSILHPALSSPRPAQVLRDGLCRAALCVPRAEVACAACGVLLSQACTSLATTLCGETSSSPPKPPS